MVSGLSVLRGRYLAEPVNTSLMHSAVDGVWQSVHSRGCKCVALYILVNNSNSVCAGSKPTGVVSGVLGLLRFLARCLTEFPIHMKYVGWRDSLDTIENVRLLCNLCSLSEETISPHRCRSEAVSIK